MSSTGFKLPLRLDLRPSRTALALATGSTLLAMVAALMSDVPPAAMLGLSLGLLTSLTIHLRRNGWIGADRRRIITLQAQSPTHWRLWQADGTGSDADRAETLWRSAGIVVLRLTHQGKRIAVLAVFADSAPADALRQLRVVLKFAK